MFYGRNMKRVSALNDETVLVQLLDTIFDAMILTVGIEDLKNIKNVERLKRELRPCYLLVDKIMECLDFGDRCIGSSTQIFNCVETILCAEKLCLLVCLESYVECVSSLFGCVTVENCIAVATDAWWDLDPVERKLLSHIITANSNCTAFDVPVFLPRKSPTVPFRLVGVCLIIGIWVTVLCGPKPDLATIQQTAFQVWSPMVAPLRSMLNTRPHSIPSTVQLHSSVLGFLLVDKKIGKYLSSSCSMLSKKESRSPSEVLKTFYYQAAASLVVWDKGHKPIETYWCSEYHKVHGVRKGDLIFCVMYSASVPTHTMRLISEESLTSLLGDSLSW
ncbi:protein fuzzy homolog isoform X2 [Halyomorpha halys]|uniref:protein fuzzy homolog isoform X2 n=1 Tax=Halyomorpha halys TaxID=286706 RepID=UPI0006D52432|nr:protein fuzzy homolog isoform X2 [Halyomorpha halys]